jgi:hypothetical protein
MSMVTLANRKLHIHLTTLKNTRNDYKEIYKMHISKTLTKVSDTKMKNNYVLLLLTDKVTTKNRDVHHIVERNFFSIYLEFMYFS